MFIFVYIYIHTYAVYCPFNTRFHSNCAKLLRPDKCITNLPLFTNFLYVCVSCIHLKTSNLSFVKEKCCKTLLPPVNAHPRNI